MSLIITQTLKLLSCLWITNATLTILPLILKKIHIKDLALDGNRKWFDGRRILGKSKTLIGIPVALFIGAIIGTIWSNFNEGLFLGVCTYFGTTISGFFKRRIGIKPGQPWIPFDEIDFVVGALVFVSPIYFPGLLESVIIVIMSAFGHIAVNQGAFYLGIRKEKW